MCARYVAEFGSTGALEISVFQALLEGKTVQPPTLGAPAGALGDVAATGVGVAPAVRGAPDELDPPPHEATNTQAASQAVRRRIMVHTRFATQEKPAQGPDTVR